MNFKYVLFGAAITFSATSALAQAPNYDQDYNCGGCGEGGKDVLGYDFSAEPMEIDVDVDRDSGDHDSGDHDSGDHDSGDHDSGDFDGFDE